MAFEIKGKLHKKFETESKTDTFQTREFVMLIQDGNYPQYIKFQLTQDRCGIIDQVDEGKDIEVHFDLRGREWNGKFFTNLNAWKVTTSTPQQVVSDLDQTQNEPPLTFDDDNMIAEDFDDLPF